MSLFLPDDSFNRTLQAQVFPPDWINPVPQERYNLVVLGGGSAGLICAAAAAGLGARVALVERRALGGDCLNVGCVPSKALLRAARAAQELRTAGRRFEIHGGDPKIDFPAVMERMRRLRAHIAPVDSARRYTEELGVDVFLGEGRFASPRSVEVEGATLSFSRAVIATGAHPRRIPVPGLWESGALTNETVFSLTELPRRLAVVGGGPIGCELAQCFARLGSAVTLVERGDSLLSRDDPDASRLLLQAFQNEGVTVRLGTTLQRVESSTGESVLHLASGGDVHSLAVDHILVATGRQPNLEGLGLQEAGIAHGPDGLRVNDRLQTTNRFVFAAGDVALSSRFTHLADASARMVVQNALFLGRKKLSDFVIPWCTYTDPEVGHVGLTPSQAREKGIEIQTFTQELSHLDRAILDDETDGFVRLHTRRGSSRLLGATVVATQAGDLLGELSLAITNGIGLDRISSTIHCYPTRAEAIRRAADAWNRTRLTPTVARLLRALLAWQRR